MSDGPVVSVVVTSYNYGRFLAGALESVLAETYSALETIVVDDGSSDDTALVAGRYRDRGVLYVHQPNAGAAEARTPACARRPARCLRSWTPTTSGVAKRSRWASRNILERHPEIRAR